MIFYFQKFNPFRPKAKEINNMYFLITLVFRSAGSQDHWIRRRTVSKLVQVVSTTLDATVIEPAVATNLDQLLRDRSGGDLLESHSVTQVS
jgi:hypothetical protein